MLALQNAKILGQLGTVDGSMHQWNARVMTIIQLFIGCSKDRPRKYYLHLAGGRVPMNVPRID